MKYKNLKKPIDWIIDKKGCFVCTSHAKDKNGYPQITRLGKSKPMSRFIYEEMFGFIPNGLVVRHKCDNPSCINPEHLELGTQKDNNDDKISRGRARYLSGEDNPNAKLTKQDVKDIRKSKLSNRKLAKIYKISHTTIGEIKRKEIWKEV